MNEVCVTFKALLCKDFDGTHKSKAGHGIFSETAKRDQSK